jgi:FtsP/CotA-like multicopper oxidase with cupredoxin domain
MTAMRSALALLLVAAAPVAAQDPGAHDHGSHGAGMRIPMPPGMYMLPGLADEQPRLRPFLPGKGIDLPRLPEARPSETIQLADGDTLDLTATLVRRTINGTSFAAYGYNGMVPGPLIRVDQAATIVVRFRNAIDLPSTVHWHGLRLDDRFDGVPGLTQSEVAVGESFTYELRFPDAGIYWYHPHVREDIQQAMGLIGNILVDATADDYYAPVNREVALMLSDLLINADTLIPFGEETVDFALMGRLGNVLLVNGEPDWRISAATGEVVRFYLTNTSNSRTWNLSMPGVQMKVVATDVGKFEREEWVESVVIAPAERYAIEARFTTPGPVALINAVQAINHFTGEFDARVDTIGLITVRDDAVDPDHAEDFAVLRENADVREDIAAYRDQFAREPDFSLTLTMRARGLPLTTVQFMNVDTAYKAPVEWADAMPLMNWLSNGTQVTWILRDEATGHENMDINWRVPVGSVVKLRIFNDPKSFHPMQHPIHLHGQRMLVLERDGVANTNLAWKDTALIPVGATVDILIDASNPGVWMLHCHIAEHLGAGMMAVLRVE